MLTKDFEQVLISEAVSGLRAYTAGEGLVFLVPLSDTSKYQTYVPAKTVLYPFPQFYELGHWPGYDAFLPYIPAGAVPLTSLTTTNGYWVTDPLDPTGEHGGFAPYWVSTPPSPTGYLFLGYMTPEYSIDARLYTTQEFQAWARPLSSGGYAPLPSWATAVMFPDETVASNGYPLVDHDGPIRGYFNVPTPTGEQRIGCDFYRDAPNRNWRPRNPPVVEGLYFSTYMGAMLFRGTFSRPFIPGVPAKYRQDPQVGWNSGAVSLDALDGDLHVTFQSSIAVGGAVGFLTAARAAELGDAGDPPRLADLLFAWYFDNDVNAEPRARIMENGKIVATVGGYDLGEDGTTFEIRRVGERVSYWSIDGGDPHEEYVSKRTGSGEWNVGAALYAGGDAIP